MNYTNEPIDSQSITTTETTKSIAFFDFDGTVTDRDSFLDFIAFYRGKTTFYLGFLWLLPVLLAYKMKIIPNWRAKEKVLSFFFNNIPLAEFQEQCNRYAEERIPQIVRAKALHAISQHQQQGHEIVIVSASPENWLKAWCQRKNIRLIASQLEVHEGKLTGLLAGNNCYGPEKVERIRKEIILENYQNVYCYGDSRGDKEMLALADFSYYRPFL